MPIYAYRCATCGHAKDALQKMSDPVLTVCPACGASTFVKQVTAAGFQLKGSGWYVTDFRGDSSGNKQAKSESSAESGEPAKADGAKSDGAKTDAPAAAAKTEASPAAAPAPTPSTPSSGSK